MSTLRTITDFKSNRLAGGARPNLFEVELPAFPAAATASGATWGTASGAEAESFKFLCAAAMPASNIAPIEVPFRGRTLKVAGDRTFDTWTVTIINDETSNSELHLNFDELNFQTGEQHWSN